MIVEYSNQIRAWAYDFREIAPGKIFHFWDG
jgi:hypothetical protein